MRERVEVQRKDGERAYKRRNLDSTSLFFQMLAFHEAE